MGKGSHGKWEAVSLGRGRDMIFRMNTWAKQRANLQFAVGKLLKTEGSVVNPARKAVTLKYKKKTHTFGSLIGTMLMQCQKITGLVFLHKIAQSITCQLSYLLIQHVKGTLWGETVLGWSRKCNNVVSI